MAAPTSNSTDEVGVAWTASTAHVISVPNRARREDVRCPFWRRTVLFQLKRDTTWWQVCVAQATGLKAALAEATAAAAVDAAAMARALPAIRRHRRAGPGRWWQRTDDEVAVFADGVLDYARTFVLPSTARMPEADDVRDGVLTMVRASLGSLLAIDGHARWAPPELLAGRTALATRKLEHVPAGLDSAWSVTAGAADVTFPRHTLRLMLGKRRHGGRIEVFGVEVGCLTWHAETALDPVAYSYEARDGEAVVAWTFQRNASTASIERTSIMASRTPGSCVPSTDEFAAAVRSTGNVDGAQTTDPGGR